MFPRKINGADKVRVLDLGDSGWERQERQAAIGEGEN
jgi:hypothetical protein